MRLAKFKLLIRNFYRNYYEDFRAIFKAHEERYGIVITPYATAAYATQASHDSIQ